VPPCNRWTEVCVTATCTNYDTIQYISVYSKADDMASFV